LNVSNKLRLLLLILYADNVPQFSHPYSKIGMLENEPSNLLKSAYEEYKSLYRSGYTDTWYSTVKFFCKTLNIDMNLSKNFFLFTPSKYLQNLIFSFSKFQSLNVSNKLRLLLLILYADNVPQFSHPYSKIGHIVKIGTLRS
jgi:hypothetical protein